MTSTAKTTHHDLTSADLTMSIAALWQAWLAATAACHAASDSDPQAALATHDHAETLALRLAAIPATILDDTRPKVILAAWHRQYGTSIDTDRALEAAITDDLLRLQPPIDTRIE